MHALTETAVEAPQTTNPFREGIKAGHCNAIACRLSHAH
jgi:hypothetical protein